MYSFTSMKALADYFYAKAIEKRQSAANNPKIIKRRARELIIEAAAFEAAAHVIATTRIEEEPS